MGFSQKRVACLMGHSTTTHFSEFERGRRLPNLETALKLEIILRIPVAFLYEERYAHLKRQIREAEAHFNNLHDE